jgi:hypothetical protein
VTERRRKQEYAEMMRYLAEEAYPCADRIRLVVDNLDSGDQGVRVSLTARVRPGLSPLRPGRTLAPRSKRVYEPITVEVDRAHDGRTYRSHSLYFVGRLIRIVKAGHTKMSLYEWADQRGRLLYLVHVERTNPVGLPGAPSIRSSIPTPAVPPPGRDTPQRRYLGLTRNSQPRSIWDLPGTHSNEVGMKTQRISDFE